MYRAITPNRCAITSNRSVGRERYGHAEHGVRRYDGTDELSAFVL